LAATAEDIEPDCDVSKQAFKERFNEFAVKFLQAMFAEALKLTVPEEKAVIPLLAAFAAVYALDSTNVGLPETLAKEYKGHGGDGPKSALKLYWLINWLTGAYRAIQFEQGRKADQDMGEQFLAGTEPGALWLFDLGFFNLVFLAAIARHQSYFVCRLYAQTVISLINPAGLSLRFDLDEFLRKAPRELFEMEVELGAEAHLKVRLILAPVPPAVAQARRRRVREDARRQGRTPRKSTLARCDWTLMVTNAPVEKLPTSAVLTIYGVRWQIELVFKLAKSEAGLARTKATNPHRVKCEIYAKLIALLLFNRLLQLLPGEMVKEISPVKTWHRMREKFDDYLKELKQAGQLAVVKIIDWIARRARSASRKKDPSTLSLLKQAAKNLQIIRLLDPLAYLRAYQEKLSDLSAFLSRVCLPAQKTANGDSIFCQ
jgi:hypothetical protein